jgi:pimeloyl-ACP methyl ester carboxylesterase
MRTIFVLCTVLASAIALPLQDGGDAEMVLVPDGQGHFHYVDLKMAQLEADAEPFFNGESDMRFLLFTRSNPTEPHEIQILNQASIDNSNFNPNHPTRITIHGWNGNANSGVNILTRNSYLNHGDFNVITVDWAVGANTINYIAARNRVGLVGEVISRLLDWLNGYVGLSMDQVYLIGHSLGAHCAGMAGKNIWTRNIDTIIGLDPALPLFSVDSPNERLADTDATYVEVIHTNAGLLGFDLPIGHTGFYPNGGRTQPGCIADVTGNCAHGRAVLFFAESIELTRRFISTQCANFNEILNGVCTPSGPNRDMGGEPSNRMHAARGVFFLTTNSGSPFAQN